LECVLESTKPNVLKQAEKLKANKKLEAREKFLLKAAKQSFYNTSPMDLSKLGSADIKSNLLTYVDSFSKDAREIFEHFKFAEFIGQLQDANLLYKVVQKVASTDLRPKAISNHDMGLVFKELIRRFAESSNETAGEHFTPRDIVRLTTSLVFMEDDDALTEPGINCSMTVTSQLGFAIMLGIPTPIFSLLWTIAPSRRRFVGLLMACLATVPLSWSNLSTMLSTTSG
jgi:type I restriction enzyme M protein